MTSGSPAKHLIKYAIPLILGNLFQLTYNAVDSIIAGQFIGRDALAAAGMASPVMNIIILGISGICMGAGVLMSNFFGGKDWTKLKKEMSTMLVFGFCFSVVVVALGIIFTKPLLKVMNGIACSAVTTVVSEAVSALLSFIYVYKKVPLLSIKLDEFTVDLNLLKTTLQYGSITALQQACQPVGKLFIQGTVNTLGVDVIAAYNAVTRVDDFALLPEQSISHGITTYVAQNEGAEKSSRIVKGFKEGILLEFLYGIIICIVVLVLNKYIMALFVSGERAENIVMSGSQYLTTMAFFYILPAFTNGVQGFFRGLGKMQITLVSTFIQTSLRVIFTVLLVPSFGIYGISFACAVGWCAMLMYEVPYYFWYKKKVGNKF